MENDRKTKLVGTKVRVLSKYVIVKGIPTFVAIAPGTFAFSPAHADPAIDTAERCVSADSTLAMQTICLHSTLDSTCSKDYWPGHCATLATFDEKARSLLDKLRAGRLTEEAAKQQLAEVVTPDKVMPSAEPPPAQNTDQRVDREIGSPPTDWKQSIELLPAGGWQYLLQSADDDSMLFASTHNVAQSGSIVSAWFRSEFRSTQQNSILYGYLSSVSREEVNCSRQVMRTIAMTWYQKNNMSGTLNSQAFDEKSSVWTPAVPGTLGEVMNRWACSKMRTHQ